MTKGTTYRNKFHNPAEDHINQLNKIAIELEQYCPLELLGRLREVIRQITITTTADKPIVKGSQIVGYGIDQTAKNLACEQIIAIAKEIKKIKGW